MVLTLKGQALEVPQIIPEGTHNDYGRTVEALEMRYNKQNLQKIYLNQVKGLFKNIHMAPNLGINP